MYNNIKYPVSSQRNIPFSEKQTSQEENVVIYPKTLLDKKKELDIDFIFEDMNRLIGCSAKDLSKEEFNVFIRKVCST